MLSAEAANGCFPSLHDVLVGKKGEGGCTWGSECTGGQDIEEDLEEPTCVNVSFVLLQGVLALESLAAALCFTDEPGVSFAGFLVLFKAAHRGKEEEEETALCDCASEGNKWSVAMYTVHGAVCGLEMPFG